MSSYQIKRMTREKIDLAVEWAAREGWNPGLNDADAFHAIDPDGFFFGELDGQPIAVGSALAYDDTFGFCGFYIVDPAHRASGYGIQLTRARLEYMGDRNVGLDGVIDMSDKYARLGYKTSHISTRYVHTPQEQFNQPEHIRAASHVSFHDLVKYDAAHFPVERERFLKAWIGQPNATALVSVVDVAIQGFGVIRQCREGYKIGPLFAQESEIAEVIYKSLCNFGLNQPVYLDIPEPNSAAMKLANKYSMQPVFSCARMYLRHDPALPIDKIYGITTFEAG